MTCRRVCGSQVMRKVDPDMKRPFKVPFVPFVPVLGFTLCGILMLSLGWPVRIFAMYA